MDVERVDRDRLAVVDAGVSAVARATGASPGSMLLIGAEARAFSSETGRPWSGDPARARRLLDSLTRGLSSLT